MDKNIVINATNMSQLVQEAFQDCLFKDGEDTSNHIKVEGIVQNFGFHPQRLEDKRELITAILAELLPVYKEGYTFLNICETKNGELWSGSHETCELLVVLAIGLGLMEYCFPREMWFVLPGRMPYVIIK